jgi:GNAT superfamily N-acetyltransferase
MPPVALPNAKPKAAEFRLNILPATRGACATATHAAHSDRFTLKPMSLEIELQQYPKQLQLKDGSKAALRPLRAEDELGFHEFFLAVPEAERMFIKHRVTDPLIIRGWCQNIDLGRHLPVLALINGKIVGVATLHQQLGGWKRHIGRVSVLVLPNYRGRGLARALVHEIADLARSAGLERVEAEFIAEQAAAIKMFALLGFSNLVRLEDYVKDMQAVSHDYILMGLHLKTDEEYAGVG